MITWKNHGHGEIVSRILVKYPPLFPVVRLGLLLFAIFSLQKKKQRKPLGQQPKESGKEKAAQPRQGPAGKEKEKEEPPHPGCDSMDAATGASGCLGWCISVVGKFRVRGLPVVCPHSGVGEGLVNNFFLVLTSAPLLSADCRRASLLFPLSHLLMIGVWQPW